MQKNKAVAKRLKRVVTGRHWIDEYDVTYFIRWGGFRLIHCPTFKPKFFINDDLPF